MVKTRICRYLALVLKHAKLISMEFLYVLAIIFGFFGISFIMINIRHIFTGNEFRGTCATNNPMLKNQVGECGVCGKAPGEDCKRPEEQNKRLGSVNG